MVLNLQSSRLARVRSTALVVAAAMIAACAMLTLSLSAFAQGPPIDGHTSPNDPRCLRTPEENLFFINMPTPATGDPSPGSTIGSWFSDESGLNQGSADPTSKFYLFFHLTGPGVDQKLTPDTTESFDQSTLFNYKHKECKKQINIKTTIPSTINGGAYPLGDYNITMKAWDNDQTRHGGDMSTQTWKFTVGPTPPSPTPTSQVSPTSGVQAASTTNKPGLPKTGAGLAAARQDREVDVAMLLGLALIGAAGVAVVRSRGSKEGASS